MANNKKQAAYKLVLESGLADTTEKAKALIMAGKIIADDKRIEKAGQLLKTDCKLRLKGKSHNYVSRAALKLAHGLEKFNHEPKDKICLDIGASTGGFTEVLLENGAKKVYAVDVGHSQLNWKLVTHPKTISLEKTDARSLNTKIIPDKIDLLTCDASFISLKKILPIPMDLVKNGGKMIALIKPQFEAPSHQIPKGGIITDKNLHKEICQDIKNWINTQKNWQATTLEKSPIKGTKGNIEFLVYAKKFAS